MGSSRRRWWWFAALVPLIAVGAVVGGWLYVQLISLSPALGALLIVAVGGFLAMAFVGRAERKDRALRASKAAARAGR